LQRCEKAWIHKRNTQPAHTAGSALSSSLA